MNGLVEHDDNTVDEAKDIKAKRESAAARRKRVKAAWEAVLVTPEGRAVVWDMIAGATILETPLVYNGGEIATLATMVEIGKREHARKMLVEIGEEYPAMLALMQQENV